MNDQSPIEFSVKYRLSEYLRIVQAHVLATAIPKDMGRFQRALHLGLLSVVATPVFFYKSWRVGVCSFKIDSAGITRHSKGGTLTVAWSEVVAIHRYDPGYLVAKDKGAMPIPFRVLSPEQLSGLSAWFAPHLPRGAT